MPYQDLGIGALDVPLRPNWAAACAQVDVPVAPAARRTPWLDIRFGFVGSSEGFDLLRFEAPTLALTPRTAPSLLASGQLDALVMECARDDLVREWGLSFLDWAGAELQARDLMRRAREAGLPRIALMRGGAGQASLFAPLAAEVDRAFVTESAARDALQARGVAADLVPPVMQPALYHGFAYAEGALATVPRVLSLDLARAIDDPAIAALLDSLAPFGLGLCSADLVVRRRRIEALPPALIEASIGSVTTRQLRELLAGADILVQVARPDRDPGPEVQHALHAAASRCVVAILGEVTADDPRRGVAQVFPDARALRLFVSRLAMDPLWAQAHLQASWRKAHRDHAAASLAARLAGCLRDWPLPSADLLATVVTPTVRPERLGEVLATFRAQTWARKELIVVANTDHPEAWDSGLVHPGEGEQFVVLPRRFGPAMALNLGAARGRGDYVLRMDDDDRYGRHYVEDVMIAASALRPDILGKPDCFYDYMDEGRLVWRPKALKRPKLYPSARIGQDGHLAGFSHVVRRSLVTQVGYPDRQQGGADSAFLEALTVAGDLLCARADALNAVVGRRTDPRSHTWQDAPRSDDPRFEEVGLSIEALLDGTAPAPFPAP